MLILARRPTESLVIGNNITLTVLAIKGNQVRLGISAPKDVVVDRAEVHARKQAEYRASAQPSAREPIHPAPPSLTAVHCGGSRRVSLARLTRRLFL